MKTSSMARRGWQKGYDCTGEAWMEGLARKGDGRLPTRRFTLATFISLFAVIWVIHMAPAAVNAAHTRKWARTVGQGRKIKQQMKEKKHMVH